MTVLRIDDDRQTLVLAATEGLPMLGYWGPLLPLGEDLAELARAGLNDLNGGMLDKLAPLTLCPVGDGVFQGQPALEVAEADATPIVPRFGPANLTAAGNALSVEAVDRASGPSYHARIALIDAVQATGMTFGLWVEPEMVNADSDLYRAHPHWILGSADQITGRNPLVLDLGQPAVRDHLFEALSALLGRYAIDCLKWDHNRLLPVLDAGQGRGVLDLLARLRAAHPLVEIETCASGGGRIDYGILQQTCRIWLSDCTDPLERLRMQHAAALFLLSAVTASDAGSSPGHTTGRTMPVAFCAWVAAQRVMGFEMDLRTLSPDEEAVLTRITTWHKANRAWMMAGSMHRLDSDDPAVTAEIQIAADGSRFVAFAGQATLSQQILPRPLRLTGLHPNALYRVTLLNLDDIPPQSRGPTALKSGPLTVSGQALMTKGLLLPIAWPATMWVVEGTRL